MSHRVTSVQFRRCSFKGFYLIRITKCTAVARRNRPLSHVDWRTSCYATATPGLRWACFSAPFCTEAIQHFAMSNTTQCRAHSICIAISTEGEARQSGFPVSAEGARCRHFRKGGQSIILIVNRDARLACLQPPTTAIRLCQYLNEGYVQGISK
jgi:hypothetical protein